ncbi:hypothetical protein [Actinoplanes sp. NPDC049265]|uniref:hypothetical protein n=1 Tax=Actinoplanes sp. NPDC049265 TaxID=3363902 RepID=UPI00371CA87C
MTMTQDATLAPPVNRRHGTSEEPYGVRRPDLAEAREALRRLYGADTATVWADLMRRSGLSGTESDPASLAKLIDAMAASDPILALCARSLRIRQAAHTHLSAARQLIIDAV